MVGMKFIKKRITKIALRAFALWVVTIFLIQIAAPNPVVEVMPENCPLNSGNCVRVDSVGTSYRYNNLEAPQIQASSLEVKEVISNWLINEKGAKILFSEFDENQNNYFLHFKDNSEFLFFPDDIYVTTACLEGSNLTDVTLQSQSRLGMGDLGVNFERFSELISYLDEYSWASQSCHIDN